MVVKRFDTMFNAGISQYHPTRISRTPSLRRLL
jgi:hypothetical protein